MADTDLKYEQLLAIVRKHSCNPKMEIDKNTVIQDLPFDGIDAMEFLDDVCRTFPIDWSAFRFHDYFHDECVWPQQGRLDKIELQVCELYDAISAGKWQDPMPDDRKHRPAMTRAGVIFLLLLFIVPMVWILFRWIIFR